MKESASISEIVRVSQVESFTIYHLPLETVGYDFSEEEEEKIE
jgi:hypothetical protein